MDLKLVHVIPIAKGLGKETLSYFSVKEVYLGSLVEAPIRSRVVPAIVVDIEEAIDSKSLIKEKGYSMKKIENVINLHFLNSAFLEACRDTASYFATNTGNVLSSVLPKIMLEELPDQTKSSAHKEAPVLSNETFVLQSDSEERFAHYKSMIREEFAKSSSVFFCLPTIEDIKDTVRSLPKGIEAYTFVLHSGLSAKELKKTWKDLLGESHPVLIIATGQYLSLPRQDIGTIIIERESSRSYKTQTRPYVDFRKFAEFLAKKSGQRLVFGDTMLRTETVWRYKNHELPEIAPLKFRFLTTSKQEIVDARENKENKEAFRVISPQLSKLIEETRDNNENLFIFSARRGHSPTISCGDCGTMASCNACSTPLVLHKPNSANNKNIFLCHKCGERRGSAEKCSHCESWKLVALGIGIEKVEEEISEKFPTIKIFRLDSDTAKTAKKAEDIVSSFINTPGAILLGTEMSLSYLRKGSISNVAIASLDSLFSIPDFRINERVLHLLLKMRELATKSFMIQTRTGNQPILELGLQGNLIDFYKQEIKEREDFGYPPFSTLIKITLSGEKSEVISDMGKLVKYFDEWDSIVFPAWSQGKDSLEYKMNLLIKLPKKSWPDEGLLKKLLVLPSQYSINVDPETLL